MATVLGVARLRKGCTPSGARNRSTAYVRSSRGGRGQRCVSASHGQHMRVFAGTAPAVSRVARWMTLQRSSVIHMRFTCGHAVDDTVLYRLRADPASVRCHVCKWAAPARRTAVSRAQSASHHRTLHAGATEHSMLVLVRWPSSSLSRPRPLPPHARLRYVAHPAGEPYV